MSLAPAVIPVHALIAGCLVLMGVCLLSRITKKGVITIVLVSLLALTVLFSATSPNGVVAQAVSSSSFSFAAAGDYGNLWSSTGETRKVVSAIASSGAGYALALGDLSYSDLASTAQSWCANYKALFNNVVVLGGNHDSGESGGAGQMDVYNQACPFSVPGVQMIVGTITDDHGTSYGYEYAFDYPATNPIARIIMIVPGVAWSCCGLSGTYTYAPGTTNYNWVSSRIDEARARAEWVIVGFHKTKGDINSGLWSLMFEKHVDLVLAGHDHEYKRTYQLKCTSSSTSCIADTNPNTYQRGAGLVYVVQGTGGETLLKLSNEPIIPPGAISNNDHGFAKYTITASSVSEQFISVDSSYTDSFTISSGSTPLAASFTANPPAPAVGQAATFTGSATGGVGPYSFAWSFGDGGSATGSSVTHSYSSAGSYTVTLTVTDSTGSTATSSQTIVVSTSYTFAPTDDTYVQQGTPTTNYGTAAQIIVDSSPIKDILLKFNVQVPGTITGATLRLYEVDSSDKGGDFHTAPTTWTESTVTWNSAPSADPAIFYSLGQVSSGSWQSIPMSSIVTGNGVVSLRITSSSPTGDGSYFASKENNAGAFAPQLIVTTSGSSAINNPPSLTVPPSQTVNEMTALSFSVSATDDPSQTITLTAQSLPTGASFSSTPAAGSVTGTLSWTPIEAQGPGDYTVSFTATDNGSPPLSTAKTVTITVSEVNSAPVVSAPSAATANVDQTTTFTVTATDGDLPANTITLAASGLVQGMSFPTVTGNPASGTFSFTPSSSQNGMTFTVTFTAADDGSPALSSSKSVTITVTTNAQPYALAVSNDGKVFRYENGAFALVGQPVTTALRAVAWKPDGSYALISGDAAVLLKYDGTQLTTISTGISTSFNFWTVSWKPDGTYALVGGTSGLLFKYDGSSISTVANSFTPTILSMSWHPSGGYALMVGRSGLALVYNGATVSPVSSGVSVDLNTVAWSTSGQYALIGGLSGILRKFDGSQITAVNTAGLTGNNTIRSIAFGPSGLGLIAGDNGMVLTYDGTTLSLVAPVANNWLYSISWSGSTAYIAGTGGTLLSYSAGVLKKLASNTTASFRALSWKPS